MGSIIERGEIVCGASAALLWSKIADTDEVNRVAGLAPIEAQPKKDGLVRHRVKTKLGPISVEYDEYPFEWVAPKRYSIRRDFLNGPLERYEISYRLTPSDGGTIVNAELRCGLRYSGLSPVAPPIMRTILAKLLAAMQKIDEALVQGEALRQVGQTERRVDEDALARATRALLDDVPSALQSNARQLSILVRDGADLELNRIRPYALAKRWSIERREALDLCLKAVLAGLLELSWDLLCPSCQVPVERASLLSSLKEHGACPVCELDFDADFDRAVEASFKPAPAVRSISERRYCTGGPALMPHVVSQTILHPEAPLELEVPEEEGRYRLFARGGASAKLDVQKGAPERLQIAVNEMLEPDQATVAPGGTLSLQTRNDEARPVKLEHLGWSSMAATAFDVSMSQVFRRFFSGQVLRANISLKIGRVALVFTDLSGSTALYTNVGDAAAFDVVQRHFEVLRPTIAEHGGVIVKTIGDAVMASFVDEVHAVRAAIEMQRAFARFRKESEQTQRVFLKVGVHVGPCYAVTANGAIDYFGQTVNLAARLEGQAKPGQVVLSSAVAERAEANGVLKDVAVSPPESAMLKGIEGGFQIVRVELGQDAG